MRHPILLVGQLLTASLLLALGLSANGCGDTATVNPEVALSRLTVTPGTLQPSFSSGTTQYSVDLTSDITSVTVSAQPAVSSDAVTINGQATTSRVIPLGEAGTTTPVNIVVSESNSNSRTYTVLLRRAGLAGNNSLDSLAVSPGTLAPAFNANELLYTVDVANTDGSVSVTPTLQDTNATMTVNGQDTDSGQARSITLNPVGQSTAIRIIVTAQNGTPKTYLVTVSRGISANNNLQSLTVSPGTLTPAFNASAESYTVDVGSGVPSVSITPTRQDSDATITVNGQAAISGQARTITLNPAGQSTLILVVVTAQNGAQKTYLVTVSRTALGGNNNLSALTVSSGSLAPAFTANTTSYTVDVASDVARMTVTPRLQDTTATMTVNGQATNSGQARTTTLNGAGSNTLITIVVTAPNGSQKTYTVNVRRAALGGNNNLSALTVSPGSLAPAFNANTTSYAVDVASDVASISVTPTLSDPAATMTVNGTAATSGKVQTVTLRAAGLSTSIPIVVTAPNGSSRTYAIVVDRALPSSNNNLSALSVKVGTEAQTLSPTFAPSITAYTANVASTVTEVEVSATKADPNAVMSVGSVTVPAGTATGKTIVQPNATPISIAVTAPSGGAPKTYSITVRQGPPAPSTAPDLIEEDDSCSPNNVIDGNPSECLPGTSRDDNVTNITTPRFRIPPPAAGQTPNLYVEGSRVDSTFDQDANTLQPTTPLSDRTHQIAYTVTIAGSESGRSPFLSVTIDTGAPGAP
jgi:hypothetical protein